MSISLLLTVIFAVIFKTTESTTLIKNGPSFLHFTDHSGTQRYLTENGVRLSSVTLTLPSTSDSDLLKDYEIILELNKESLEILCIRNYNNSNDLLYLQLARLRRLTRVHIENSITTITQFSWLLKALPPSVMFLYFWDSSMNRSFGTKFSLPSNIQQLYLYRSNCQALLDCILVPIESNPCQESLFPFLHLEGASIPFQQLTIASIKVLDLGNNNFIDQSKELIELCFSLNSKLSTINLSGSTIDQETFFTHLTDFLSTKKVCFEFSREFIDKFYCYIKLPAHGRTFKFELCFEENDEYEYEDEDGDDDDEEHDEQEDDEEENFEFLDQIFQMKNKVFKYEPYQPVFLFQAKIQTKRTLEKFLPLLEPLRWDMLVIKIIDRNIDNFEQEEINFEFDEKNYDYLNKRFKQRINESFKQKHFKSSEFNSNPIEPEMKKIELNYE